MTADEKILTEILDSELVKNAIKLQTDALTMATTLVYSASKTSIHECNELFEAVIRVALLYADAEVINCFWRSPIGERMRLKVV